jgi:hypothetical protein
LNLSCTYSSSCIRFVDAKSYLLDVAFQRKAVVPFKSSIVKVCRPFTVRYVDGGDNYNVNFPRAIMDDFESVISSKNLVLTCNASIVSEFQRLYGSNENRVDREFYDLGMMMLQQTKQVLDTLKIPFWMNSLSRFSLFFTFFLFILFYYLFSP